MRLFEDVSMLDDNFDLHKKLKEHQFKVPETPYEFSEQKFIDSTSYEGIRVTQGQIYNKWYNQQRDILHSPPKKISLSDLKIPNKKLVNWEFVSKYIDYFSLDFIRKYRKYLNFTEVFHRLQYLDHMNNGRKHPDEQKIDLKFYISTETTSWEEAKAYQFISFEDFKMLYRKEWETFKNRLGSNDYPIPYRKRVKLYFKDKFKRNKFKYEVSKKEECKSEEVCRKIYFESQDKPKCRCKNNCKIILK